jgi:hypothetical protein
MYFLTSSRTLMSHICTLGVPKYKALRQSLEDLRLALTRYEQTGLPTDRQACNDFLKTTTDQLTDYEDWLLTPIIYRDQQLVTSDALVLEGLNQALKNIGQPEIEFSSDDNRNLTTDNFITKLSLVELNLPYGFDLSQLVRLSRLEYFCCAYNPNLNTSPKLSSSVREVRYRDIGLTDSAIDFPPNLLEFECSGNADLEEPPIGLPKSLKKFTLAFNQRLRRISVLHEGLEVLECCDNNLTELPDSLPNSVKIFDCGNNPELRKLPNLHEGLEELVCSNIGLTSMPNLPESLKTLDVSNNSGLITLSNLPTGLTKLRCRNIGLIDLPPSLPSSLRAIDCTGNPLSTETKARLRDLQNTFGVVVWFDEH